MKGENWEPIDGSKPDTNSDVGVYEENQDYKVCEPPGSYTTNLCIGQSGSPTTLYLARRQFFLYYFIGRRSRDTLAIMLNHNSGSKMSQKIRGVRNIQKQKGRNIGPFCLLNVFNK